MRNFDLNERFLKSHWKEISQPACPGLKHSFNTIHHGIQFLAITGKYLLPPRSDDSNIAMEWIPQKNVVATEWIHADTTFRVCMQPDTLKLEIFNYNWSILDNISLQGKTNCEVYSQLKTILAQLGADVSGLSFDLHYDIPMHPTDKGETYQIDDPELFHEISIYYSNAGIMLSHLKANIWDAGQLRCRPRHFDMSFIITLERENNEAVKTINVGFGPPDTYSQDPYFFISTRSKSGTNLSGLPKPGAGRWNDRDWQGAVLPVGEILKAGNINDQVEIVIMFIREGLKSVYDKIR